MYSAALIAAVVSAVALLGCAPERTKMPSRGAEQVLQKSAPRNTESASVQPGSPHSPPLPQAVPLPRPPWAPPASLPVPAMPKPPVPVTICDPGGCWNSGASRYNGGTGDTFLDPGGRLCQRNGTWMQCF